MRPTRDAFAKLPHDHGDFRDAARAELGEDSLTSGFDGTQSDVEGRSDILVAVSYTHLGLQLTTLKRPDECCGFGGTFAVVEEAVSCMMGEDRVFDHEQAGTQVLTANDMSCLMHLQGIIRRDKKPIRVMHVAEILAGDKA